MSNIEFTKDDTSYNYDGIAGKALLEYRTGIQDHCSAYDPFGECNIMECLYCNNCYYKITMENGESISNCGDFDLSSLRSDSRGIEDYNHEILFYDYIPDIDDLFSYLFDEKSKFKILRTSDNIIMVDNVKSKEEKKHGKSK